MRIISTLLPAEMSAHLADRPSVVMAFDTLVDEKSLVVGITVGRVNGPELADVRLSALGQTIMERCRRHHVKHYPQSAPVVVAGVASVTSAKKRVRDVLLKAPPQAFVLLVCANDKVYDAAFPALGLNVQAAGKDVH